MCVWTTMLKFDIKHHTQIEVNRWTHTVLTGQYGPLPLCSAPVFLCLWPQRGACRRWCGGRFAGAESPCQPPTQDTTCPPHSTAGTIIHGMYKSSVCSENLIDELATPAVTSWLTVLRQDTTFSYFFLVQLTDFCYVANYVLTLHHRLTSYSVSFDIMLLESVFVIYSRHEDTVCWRNIVTLQTTGNQEMTAVRLAISSPQQLKPSSWTEEEAKHTFYISK